MAGCVLSTRSMSPGYTRCPSVVKPSPTPAFCSSCLAISWLNSYGFRFELWPRIAGEIEQAYLKVVGGKPGAGIAIPAVSKPETFAKEGLA